MPCSLGKVAECAAGTPNTIIDSHHQTCSLCNYLSAMRCQKIFSAAILPCLKSAICEYQWARTWKPTNMRIAIIDDNVELRESYEALFELSGHQPESFCSAEEFLETPSCSFGAVIIDLNLSGMSGMDLIGQLVQSPPHPLLILMTGSEVNLPVAFEGQVHLIIKPCNPQMLLNLLNSA
ncbi:MAG: response regulator [Pirellulaceae bacterium]